MHIYYFSLYVYRIVLRVVSKRSHPFMRLIELKGRNAIGVKSIGSLFEFNFRFEFNTRKAKLAVLRARMQHRRIQTGELGRSV